MIYYEWVFKVTLQNVVYTKEDDEDKETMMLQHKMRKTVNLS